MMLNKFQTKYSFRILLTTLLLLCLTEQLQLVSGKQRIGHRVKRNETSSRVKPIIGEESILDVSSSNNGNNNNNMNYNQADEERGMTDTTGRENKPVAVHERENFLRLQRQKLALHQEKKFYVPKPVVSSCQQLGKCCQGKDNQCKIKSHQDNETMEPENKYNKSKADSCFCDSACLALGDCCHDYTDYCKAIDCVLAEHWEDWGECDVKCGQGIQSRTRKVLQPAINAGKACSSTVEKKPCEGTDCKVARAPDGSQQKGETAKIIPGIYGKWRNDKLYHPYKDIRKNLFDFYQTKNRITRPNYCSFFVVTEVQSTCNGTLAAGPDAPHPLDKNSRVCSECAEIAMKKEFGNRCLGEGYQNMETRWNAILVNGCHGKWVMVEKRENCSCIDNISQNDKLSFVLL